MKFIKIVWILSVFIIIVFNLAFEGFRIYDFITENYNVKTMKVSNYNYSSSSKRKSITINGYIGKEDVYFTRFDDEIEELFSMYPGITIENKQINELNSVYNDTFKNSKTNSKNIEVLKFKHSDIVMLIKDDEFKRWKTRLYMFSSYSIISIVILILIKKK